MRRLVLAAAFALLVLASATAAGADVRLVPVGTFTEPVYVSAPFGDAQRLFVVERAGLVRLVRDGRVLRRPFADLRRHVLIRDPQVRVDQRGLFSIAFARDYRHSGLLYAMYAARDGHLRVDELRRSASDSNRTDPRGRRPVIDLGPAGIQHHGGQLQVDRDGLLWISTGQEDDPASSQDLGSLNGKLLRIDPRRTRTSPAQPYAIPPDNPYVARADARPEIVASGLRNPWRFSLDARSGLALIGDVGEQAVEEVDALSLRDPLAGANFGWPLLEGRGRVAPTTRDEPAGVATPAPDTLADAVAPLLVQRHDAGWCSLVGGVVVRDPALRALRGRYIYGDVCSGRLRSARITSVTRATDDRALTPHVPYLVSFGVDARRRLYAVSLSGTVWRFAQATSRKLPSVTS
jgi:glucose/arabinose dehydrogenase